MVFKGMFRKGKDQEQDAPLASPKPARFEDDLVVPVAVVSQEPPPRQEPREVPPLPMQTSPVAREYAAQTYAPVAVPAEVPAVAAERWATSLISVSLLAARTVASLVRAGLHDQSHHERQMEVIMSSAARQVAQGDLKAARVTLQKYLRQTELHRVAHVRLGAALDLQERIRGVQQEALTLRDLAGSGEPSALAVRMDALTSLLDALVQDQVLWGATEEEADPVVHGRRHWDTPAGLAFVEEMLVRLQAQPVAVQH